MMSNLIFILLQVAAVFYTLPADQIPKKSMENLSNKEVSQLMTSVSEEIKIQEVTARLDDVSARLNGSVLLARGHKIIYYKCVGYKRLYENVPNLNWTYSARMSAKRAKSNLIDKNTLIELASVSKQFTAAAALKLIIQGKLDTNDLLTKYFPTLPYPSVRVYHLLSHTSGLPDYIDFKDNTFNQSVTLTNSQLIKYFELRKPVKKCNPGVRFDYCNTNYAFLASIIEKISGQSFISFVRDSIMRPAGLNNSYFYPELSSSIKLDFSSGHLGNGREVDSYFMNNVLGDKGVYSTTTDLYQWAKAYFMDYKVLPKKWVESASTPHNFINKKIPEEPYGYGLRIEFNPYYGKLVYHGGLWRGFHNLFLYRPADQLVLIFLSNYRNRAHSGKSNYVLAILDGA